MKSRLLPCKGSTLPLSYGPKFMCKPIVKSDDLAYTLPVCRVVEGGSLDTTLLPDLTPDEERDYNRIVSDLKIAASSKVTEKKEAFTKRLSSQGLSDEAIDIVLKGKGLPSDFIVTLASGENVTVADIKANPSRYHGLKCQDLGDPNGKFTRTVIYSDGDNPAIHDFRTGIQYPLLNDQGLPELKSTDKDSKVAGYLVDLLRSDLAFDTTPERWYQCKDNVWKEAQQGKVDQIVKDMLSATMAGGFNAQKIKSVEKMLRCDLT